jgi:membrane-associated phospholipid phosphatase
VIASAQRGVEPRTGTAPVRWPLLALGLAAATIFGLDTILAIGSPYLAFDVPVERFVQATPWGGLVGAFRLVDWLEGVRQVVLALLAVGLVFVVNRRATPLVVVGALSGAAYSIVELLVHRPRPPAGLVHVVRHTNGFSYPSGHAAFFAWLCILLIVCLAFHRLPRPVLALAWLAAGLVMLAVCIGRVYDGEHWPSDVIGGLMLGLAWTSLALSVRRLSDPALDPGAHR